VAARDTSLGQTAADELGTRFVALDVTDEDSVTEAAALVAAATGGRLDVLINNAGIAGGRKPAGEVTADDMRSVFETNVFGIVRVTRAFLPLLQRSDGPVIVNVSSGMGSIAVTTDPQRFESTLIGLAYPSSKTAVNMLTTQYAKAFPQFRINAVDPGYTATDLNGNNGTQSVEEGTDAIVAMATIGPSGPTGTFVDRNGSVAW
jgi:NAD(P)-dependent dehydrogenase (short-subunit alcohol dehydrogenase family)